MKDRGIDALVNDSLVGTGTSFPLLTYHALGSVLASYTLLRDRIKLTISYHVGRLVHFPTFSFHQIFEFHLVSHSSSFFSSFHSFLCPVLMS
jgi:hypothetical protein